MAGRTLRFVTLSLTPEGWFGDPDEIVFDDPALEHGPVYDATLLPDGTAVVLYELRGDTERIEVVLDAYEADDVAYATTHDGSGVLVYSHSRPRPTVAALLERARALALVVDGPMEFRPDGTLRVTLVGDERAVGRLFEDVPEDVSVAVERTGEYEPRPNRIFASLTVRQREILRVAVELGYYEQPRATSYGEIAEVVGCSEANVGEHIRRIEARIVDAVVP